MRLLSIFLFSDDGFVYFSVFSSLDGASFVTSSVFSSLDGAFVVTSSVFSSVDVVAVSLDESIFDYFCRYHSLYYLEKYFPYDFLQLFCLIVSVTKINVAPTNIEAVPTVNFLMEYLFNLLEIKSNLLLIGPCLLLIITS